MRHHRAYHNIPLYVVAGQTLDTKNAMAPCRHCGGPLLFSFLKSPVLVVLFSHQLLFVVTHSLRFTQAYIEIRDERFGIEEAIHVASLLSEPGVENALFNWMDVDDNDDESEWPFDDDSIDSGVEEDDPDDDYVQFAWVSWNNFRNGKVT